MEQVFNLFLPERMMHRAELTKARCMLRKLDRIRDQSGTEGLLPKNEQKEYPYFMNFMEPIQAEMDALAADVWKREAGLERYSVVHTHYEEIEFRLQVLLFSFEDASFWEGGWVWHFRGRGLRKDGTLSFRNIDAWFRFANIKRRHLDGVWRELYRRDTEGNG
jgi:hypothetical protein